MARVHPLLLAAAAVVVVAALHVGRAIFVPIALAVVLSLLLAPLVRGLERRLRMPRAAASPLVVLLFAASLAGLGLVVTRQTVGLMRDLPLYRENIEAKLSSLRPMSTFMTRLQETAKEIGREGPPKGPRPGEPVKVEVVDSGPDQLTLASGALGFMADVSQTVAVALLLSMFFLANQRDVVERIIRLAGPGRVTVTTQALYEAAHGVSRYLGTQALVNGGFGLTLGAGLLVLGVPNALLWGLLGALLRFLPYVGPVVGCSLPVILSFAVFEGWARPLATLGFIVAIELLLNNLVEPLVYSARTGLSPIAIVLSAVTWGWLWGPLGLVLAVPLSVCLAALGRCVPSLRFLSVVLGSEAPIEAPVALYHRLLTMNNGQALDLLEKSRGDEPLEESLDALLLPVLAMASGDLHRGELEPGRSTALFESTRELLNELAEDRAASGGPPEPGHAVACLPAGEVPDDLVCEMLARSLGLRGYRAEAAPSTPLANEKADLVESSGAEVACIAAIGPPDLLRLRYLYKRLRRRFPQLPVVVVVWGLAEDELESIARRIVPDGRAKVVSSLSRGVHEVRLALQSPAPIAQRAR